MILKKPDFWRHTSSILNREAQTTTTATHVMEIAALRVTSSMPIARYPRPTLGHAGLMPREPSALVQGAGPCRPQDWTAARALAAASPIAGECGPKQFRGYKSDWEPPLTPELREAPPKPALPTVAPLALSKRPAGLSFAHSPASQLRPHGYAPADTQSGRMNPVR